jgi:hypothetical protein
VAARQTKKFRPHGHSGADSTKFSAERKVLMDHFGRYYHFVQRLGGLPVLYFIIGAIEGRPMGWATVFIYGLTAGFYAFFFHLLATSVFAAKAKIGCNECPEKTFGYFWSSIFVARMAISHLVMLSCLIWLNVYWFLASGLIIYIFDNTVTFISCGNYIVEQGSKTGKGKKSGG